MTVSDRTYLDYPQLKNVLFEEVQPLFLNRPYVMKKWREHAQSVSEQEIRYGRPVADLQSFGVLWYLFAECIYYQMPINRLMVRTTVQQHEEVIRAILLPFIRQEFPREEIQHSRNEQQVENAIGKDYIYTSMDTDWHLIREMFAKNDFEPNPEGTPTTELVDGRGTVKGVAEYRPLATGRGLTQKQQEIWDDLVSEAIHSLDDMTADLFDIVAYLWMVSPRTSDGYIEFHSDDALKIRHIQPRKVRGKEVGYREEDRFAIMKRVVALSSIWVSLGDDKVEVIEEDDPFANERYKFRDFQRLFEISGIRMAYDKQTNEPLGAYAVQIKPAPLLIPYLEGAKRSIGILDLRSFQYNPRTQKSHKRLTRYLGWQFKIRSARRNYAQSFKVSTLLRVMDMRESLSGEELRTRFEETLDDLQRDGVIKEWQYVGGFDEERVGERGWIKHYFSLKQVVIRPPDEVVEWNGKPILLPSGNRYTADLIDKIMGMSLKNRLLVEEESRLGMASEMVISKEANRDLLPKRIRRPSNKAVMSIQEMEKRPKKRKTESIAVTPVTIRKEREIRKVSIRQASKEMGVAHTTLSRFEKGDIQKLSKENLLKIKKWLNL